MPVLSDPTAAFARLPGQSHVAYAKLAKECTSLSLADKGLQQLCGLERFRNLSVLVLSRNRLTKIDQLDDNFRIRVLIAQGNQICTLKGSLAHMKFLQELDLSNNQLRNLQKIKRSLERFEYLETLNLLGNPCCEEVDYRITLIDAIKSLVILDCHTVSPSERKQAVERMHPRPPLRVGFGSTVPPPCSTERVPRESFHERKAYEDIRAMHERQAAEAELAANIPPNTFGFSTPPFAEVFPPPGWHVCEKPSDPIVQPSSQEGQSSEMCLRRDVYHFNAVVKSVMDCTAPEQPAGAQPITLEPDAYREFTLKQAPRSHTQLHARSIRI